MRARTSQCRWRVMSKIAVLERFRRWDGLSRLEAILSAKRREPNFFRIVTRVLRVEGVHSDLLAWLLDPNGWHGLKDTFATAFVAEILRQADRTLVGSIS